MELLGFEENRTTPLTTDPLSVPMPSPSPYVYDTYIRIRPKVKMYAVRFLQERLIELKYLPANSVVDGDYGVGTRAAVKAFQQAAGLEISEYAEPEMQARFSRTPRPLIRTPYPRILPFRRQRPAHTKKILRANRKSALPERRHAIFHPSLRFCSWKWAKPLFLFLFP